MRTGFRNWKKACEKGRGFLKHQEAEAHQEAFQRFMLAPITNYNVGDLISTEHQRQKKINRANLLKIISNIRFLGNS